MNAAVIAVGMWVGLIPIQDARTKPMPTPADPAEAAVRAAGSEFVRAYDAGDAAALAALFTDGAELRGEHGESVVGRDAIRDHFARVFAEQPGAKITVELESVRTLAPGVAIEEGRSVVTPSEADAEPEHGRYEAIHVLEDGKWRQARVREMPGGEPSAHDRLKPLEWLLGDWVDEGPDGLVHSSCAWSEDGQFLLRRFEVTIGGKPKLSVTQRIGWDATLKQVRSWVFDSEGGHGEQTWARDAEGRWIIKSTGVMADGRRATATNIFARTGEGSATWTSTDRTAGGLALGDGEVVRLVRRPPAPK